MCDNKQAKEYHNRRPPRLFNAPAAARQSTYRNIINTPSWANFEYIKLFYQIAQEEKAQVDHIVPLNHPLVCGLHVEDNLQVVTRKYNNYKSNRFWPQMPEYSYEDYSVYFS